MTIETSEIAPKEETATEPKKQLVIALDLPVPGYPHPVRCAVLMTDDLAEEIVRAEADGGKVDRANIILNMINAFFAEYSAKNPPPPPGMQRTASGLILP